MAPSPAYTLTGSALHEGGITLHRAIRNADGRPVVLKVLDPCQCGLHDIERLEHEHEIGASLLTPAVVKPLALDTHQGMPALVLEDFGGEALDGLCGAPTAIERFLPLSIRIAEAVAAMHREGVLHKNLKPANLLLDPTTGEVKIAGLGLATRLPREQQTARPPRLIEGSLPYLAPEQTGRTNRAIDERSDLYSLGVIFFEMLAGRLPFEAKDAAEWVHCHVARVPPSPAEIVPDLPEPIARIVLKLLSKMPEDRYQSARGLCLDLERCREEWQKRGHIEPFAPGERDFADRLQIPQKLHGRGAEMAFLRSAFERVTATGTPELLLVSGPPGIGKSALVRELQRPIVRERGSFLSGKVDPHERDVPHSTLVRALREMVIEILAESEERLADYRERIAGVLGINAQLVVDVIPQLGLVLGPQPRVAELPPAEAQNRFRRVFRRFLGALAWKEHPVVLFLDDLQWADPESLGLLSDLCAPSEIHHLLVIGAYRDSEVGASHPLVRAVDEARRAGARVSHVALGPIPPEHFAALVGDALRCRPGEAAPLAALVGDKTAYNPFFAIQFLLSLHEERLIELDARAGAFRWDVAKIRAKGFTDNVLELMAKKLVRLGARTREALALLSCLGSEAEASLLSIVSGTSEERVHADLREAVCAGLVLRQTGTYRFLHDRVREAACSMIPDGERAALHAQIGRLLLARAAPAEIEERIFEIVGHLDEGAAQITSPDERERLAELNLAAARRGRRSGAHASALGYLAAGAALLPEDRWERRYELTFAIEISRAECELFTGELSAAEERLAMLRGRARDLVDASAVACAQITLHMTQDRSDRGVAVGVEYLKSAGIELSPHPSGAEVEEQHERLCQDLQGRRIEDLVHLPEATDPRARAAADVLIALIGPASFTDDRLLCLAACRRARLDIEQGACDASYLAFAHLGQVLGPYFGDYRTGFRFGQLALDLLDLGGELRFRARAHFLFAMFVNPWTRPIQSGADLVRRSFDTAVETGDLLCACGASCGLTSMFLASGEPLGEALRQIERALEFTRKAKFGAMADIALGQRRLVRALLGSPGSPAGESEVPEARFEAHLAAVPGLVVAEGWYWIRKLQALSFLGDFAAARAAAAKAETLLWTTGFALEAVEYHFHAALSRAAHDDAPPGERQARRDAIAAHLRILDSRASNCPENFQDRRALVAAELARIEGRELDAERLYEEAIRCAQRSGFVHGEAIACEVASRFYRARGFGAIADTYLCQARACYARWGAGAKVSRLDGEHPHLAEPRSPAAAATLAVRPEQLDMVSVTKASQTVSGEIVLERLVRTLLSVVLEQGGAQRACLLLCEDSGFTVEGEAVLEDGQVVTALREAGTSGCARGLPDSLVSYVRRTKERVLLSDAAATPSKLAGDDYVARVQPRSVLCMPILRQAEVIGLLYLENNLLTGAFTPERLSVLELLATQAAISLQNALLLEKERAARSVAEEAERRAAFLAEAGEILSRTLEYEETLARLGRLCVGSLCSFCVIDVVEGGEIRRLAGAHRDPGKEPLLLELQRRYPPSGKSPVATVLRTGATLVYADLTDERLQAMAEDAEHATLLRALGTRRSMIVPLVARGQTLGALSLVSDAPGRERDAADLELAQEVARRAASAIDNARLYRASQEAVRVRSEFLTVASHELNTPVTSLMLAAQALRRAAPEGQAIDPKVLDRLLGLVERQASRLTRLVSELLDVSRIDAQRAQLALTDVDLGALVREVLERFGAEIARSGCAVSLQDEGDVKGSWDPSRIDRVITNLLSNALKFGAGKPVEIAVASARGVARLTVRDHGIGIAEAEHGRIFGRFERAVSERHYGGLGLGLYISRRIVEDHGGSIRCESRPGAGATFTVELPCARPPGAAPGPPAEG